MTDAGRFEVELLQHLRITADQLSNYVDEMRAYRDKFLAHLDDLPVMNIPILDRASAAVEFFHGYVVQNEVGFGDLAGLPTNLHDYHEYCLKEATQIYNRYLP